MGELKPYKHGYYLWLYVPSLGAAVVFLLFFAGATVLHTYRLIKTRTWFYIPFAMGGIFEIYGYGGRCGAYKNTASLFAYALSNNGALLAPVLFAASIYMTLSRIIRAVRGEQHSIIPMKWLTKVFVVGDIASFAVQASSTGLSVTSHGTAAKAVVLLGLFIQLISFGFFGVTAAVFYRRVLRAPTSECFHSNLPWESSLHMLFAVSALIMIRSIFRVIEYWGGESGYLLQHEWPMYVFDSVPMLVVMALFYIRYPSCIRDKGHDKEQSERPIDAVG
ncbi:putative RTA1 domain protein [Aspergillus pseudonomiae]|uniref:Putative RTA1 domain protein n=1 Tax=Aspergillus pseudonomiae TaxID=1506151 RepID=A0A5N7D9N9_9EURO|nr:putative RTA1 domain protein [Aspergillus pseudonomiae]KAB8257580.1 putative RTA1 domain protein [Aspergillus pseudonomiae]KAE8402954.1 putative RTA1 domain protein [Aspergillus pseudonomiae]